MIRFGLLGCGRIAKRHSELLGGSHIEGARLAAVCDPLNARADAIAARFGVPAFYDIGAFLAREDIDVVSVLTPSGSPGSRHIDANITMARSKARECGGGATRDGEVSRSARDVSTAGCRLLSQPGFRWRPKLAGNQPPTGLR